MLRKLNLLLFLFTAIAYSAYGQTVRTNSLFTQLKTAKEDTNKVNILNALSEQLKDRSNYDSSLVCAKDADSLAVRLKFEQGEAKALLNMSIVFWSKGNYTAALDYDNRALYISKKINDKKGMAAGYSSIGSIYESEGDYPKALDNVFKSLSISEELNDKHSIATNYSNIAIVYADQGNMDKALENAMKALDIYKEKEISDTLNIARSLGNIGSIYLDIANYPKAVEYDSMALVLYKKINNRDGIAINLENLGLTYDYEGKYSLAIEYDSKAAQLYKEDGDMDGLAYTYIGMGGTYTKFKKYTEAQKYLDSALIVAKSIGSKADIEYAFQYRSTLDSAMGNSRASLEDYKQYIIYRDSLLNEANTKKSVQAEMNYEFQQKQAIEKAEQDKKDALAEQERKRQALIRNTFIAGFILMLALAFFILRGLIQKQRANAIITKQKEEVEQQKMLVEQQKAIVEEKNKDITDSIHYASRIQRALLTSQEYIGKYVKEYFVLFKPRDIVSGDFYWAFNDVNSVFHIACCDCTGHGVPGAFMSLLNISMLNETVVEKGVYKPDQILNDIRENIIKALNPKGLDSESKDGMDCAYCAIDTKGMLYAACANNPIWIVKAPSHASLFGHEMELQKVLSDREDLGGADRFVEIPPDKMPVGMQYGTQKPFTLHQVQLNKGDCIYMFTDGYADQFGGPKGKKFKYKQLQEKLLAISSLPMAEQKTILDKTIDDWKGHLEQVDDVLIIGIRV